MNHVGSDLMLQTGIEDQRARLVTRAQAESGVVLKSLATSASF